MNESEWRTRKQHINIKLRALTPQWEIIPYREGLGVSRLQCHAVEQFPTANGPADYALFVSGKLLGIIEAKKVSVSPQNVLEQANVTPPARMRVVEIGTGAKSPSFSPAMAK